MNRILWLTQKGFSGAGRASTENYMRNVGLNPANVSFVNMHNRVPGIWQRKGKATWYAPEEKKETYLGLLDQIIAKVSASLIVVQDKASLQYLTGQKSLDLCRGSVYYYHEIPIIVVDEIQKTRSFDSKSNDAPRRWGSWVFVNDVMKIKRWFDGSQRSQPAFVARYCNSISDLHVARDFLNNCIVIANDHETCQGFITVTGYTGLNSDGVIRSFGIPFFNPLKPNNTHWENEEDEILAWEIVKEINENKAIKVYQNGSYDNAYSIKYRIPPVNYLLDCMHLWHSIYSETPKKINFISSIILDYCRYWKDENKEDAGKEAKRKADTVPRSKDGYERYLRYNLLDTYNTLLDTLYMVKFMSQEKMAWALRNYNTEFRNQVGPAMFMSMTGIRRNKERQHWHNLDWIRESKQAQANLKKITDDPDFNPKSPKQVASFIYDTLGATPIKQRGAKKMNARTVDEKMLKLIKVQHPIFNYCIEALWDAKKPANNASKYGTMYCPNERYLYQYSAAGTKFGRYSGKGHMFWCGTNPQNIPKKARGMFVADEGYVLCEADYSQSDAWFVAYESEDPNYIKNISDDRDTHCSHAEFFFGRSYQEVYEAHLKKEDWCEHPVFGVRQNTKRITHGAGYQMAGWTLYVTMGHEATVAAAESMGHKDAPFWDREKLTDFCAQQIKRFYKMYPGLPPWFNKTARDCAYNGNLATCAFGFTHLFFGNVLKDNAVQRQLSSFYGQGGTAGNINRTLLDVYYKSGLIQDDLMLLLQTHDSITWQSPKDKYHSHVAAMKEIMEESCEVNGRTFSVPTDHQVGLSWELSMLSYRPDITYEEILAYDKKKAEMYETVTEVGPKFPAGRYNFTLQDIDFLLKVYIFANVDGENIYRPIESKGRALKFNSNVDIDYLEIEPIDLNNTRDTMTVAVHDNRRHLFLFGPEDAWKFPLRHSNDKKLLYRLYADCHMDVYEKRKTSGDLI